MLCVPIQYYTRNGATRFKVDLSFTHEGEYLRMRKGAFRTAKEALQWAEGQYFGITNGWKAPPVKQARPGRPPREKVYTFKEVVDLVKVEWLKDLKESTVKNYICQLRFNSFQVMGDKAFHRITEGDINKVYGGMKARKNTFNIPFLSLLRVAKKLKLQVPPLGDSVFIWEKTTNRDIYLTPEELEALLENCQPEFKHLFACLAYSGVRVGEALGLLWTDVDLKGKTLSIKRQKNIKSNKITTTKNGKERTIPIDDNIIKILRSYAQSKGSTWVLSGPVFDLKYKYINLELIRCRQYVGKKIVVHSLRHTAASLMIQAGVGLDKIGAILGQSSKEITAQYAHLDVNSLRSAIATLPSIMI